MKNLSIDKMIQMVSEDKKLKSVLQFSDPLTDPREVVKVTRQNDRLEKSKNTFIVTIGKPAYAERELILRSKKAKLPVKKLILKHIK